MLALRTREERAIGGAEHCRLRTDILIRQIDMGALVDREPRVDLGLLLAGADLSTARVSGTPEQPVITAERR